ncbi:alpha-L-fucosidase isoform X3 [Patella vulgata]|nr:alpha-L-fucosidase isoform X3 [Patella vulgata]
MSSRTVLIFCAFFVSVLGARYDPTWDSIDSRPLPAWYDEAKLGIFIHWGVFAVPSINSEWFWERWQGSRTPEVVNFMKNNYRPDFTYADFAPQFTAEFFDANQWANMFNASGAEYIVFVSKHHEGYTNWPSNHSFNWNSMAVGPKRDIVGELAAAIKTNTSIHFGVYHSLFEWFHPLYLQDKENNFSTQNFVIDKTMPELYELVNTYKPDVIWSDGDWEATSDYWQSKEFLSWLYTDSPVKDTVVTNDRWGKDSTCKHGGFFTCQDRYQPGKLQSRKWENAMTIDRRSWGYRRNAQLSDYLSTEELLSTFIETVSFGGNMLMNVGPTKEGTIHPLFEERLRDVGSWLNVNGEAIRSSRPWTSQNDTLTPHVW